MLTDTESLISHLEALRSTILKCFLATAILYLPAYWAAGPLIDFLVAWSFPEDAQLHYFSLMEVFLIKLKMALVLALAAAYPWNIRQVWLFLLPALYDKERRALRWWILASSLLFFLGVLFCCFTILPILVHFSYTFANEHLSQVIGLASFLELTGWLALAFGLMFQAPVVVMLAVRFGLVRTATLRSKRPHIIVTILILAAILTPPDVLSQLILAVPTWLLFEIGLLLASRLEPKY